MNALTIRHLLIDMKPPMARHWNGGEVFLSAFFDALSMSFPVGEQFFIDALREGSTQLPPDEKAAWSREIQGFVGQEATHRRLLGCR
jgi:predicted metal-dependent hydrolase